MSWADYHVHSEHSPDSTAELELICDAALAKDVREFCVTDHIDPGHPTCDQPPVFNAWLADIARCREEYPGLVIRTGLEIGDNAALREDILRMIDPLPLDFRLLSLHLVDGLDPYDSAFFEGRTQEEAYRRYVEVKLESVLHFSDYDAVAHLGYCGKFAPYPPAVRALRWRHAPDHIDMLLRFLAQNGKALEINTSGLKQTDSPIPGWDILRRFAELGGEFVTLGSDAHAPEYLAYRFDDARRIAVSAGLKWGVTFKNRKPTPYKLEE